jgi:hypothetical protein
MGEFMKIQYDDRDFRGSISDKDFAPTIRRIEKAKNRKIKIDNILVLIGLTLVNVATFPSLYNVLVLGLTPPPATLTGGVMLGLFFYFARAIRNFKTEWVYAIGELIGIMSNGILLAYALSV